jgi:hypothetical protein
MPAILLGLIAALFLQINLFSGVEPNTIIKTPAGNCKIQDLKKDDLGVKAIDLQAGDYLLSASDNWVEVME